MALLFIIRAIKDSYDIARGLFFEKFNDRADETVERMSRLAIGISTLGDGQSGSEDVSRGHQEYKSRALFMGHKCS